MLYIHLFGQPHLSDGEQPLKFSTLPKTWPLWAYLLLHRAHPIERETLAFALWPDDPEARARANLRRHLQDLRGTLPPAPPDRPWMLIDTRTVQWNTEAECWLDVVEFERLSASVHTLAEAVTLYKGDLLENVYDDWLFYERERIRNLYLADLNQLSAQSRAQRDYPAATAYAWQLLASDPFREDALRQLIAVRYEAGDRSGALQEYDHFAHRLREELGVEPMPETVALHEAVTRNARLPGEVSAELEPPPSTLGPLEKARRLVLPFVGRDAELEQLMGWWSRAARGRGGLVMLGGEAGIGKSRLAAQLGAQAAREGARVLLGSTTFAEPVPYQALVEALRSALPMLAALEVQPLWLAALAALIPELRARRGGAADPLPALVPLDPERERTRLFEGLARCLEGLAQPRPVLLILEDLHWADSATAGLLEFLARRVEQYSVLILVTYREEETPRAHPLRDLRRRLQRENQLRHLALGPLSVDAVDSLLVQVPELGPIKGEIARELYTKSEGQPFFLSELIRELLDTEPRRITHASEEALAPGGVRALIAARMARLSPQARSLAEVASVVGMAFAIEPVREVSAWDESQVLDTMDELLDRGLVHEVVGRSQADYAFTHYLVQAAIYSGISPALLERRHRRLAQVMEDVYAHRLEELSGELALHFDRGKQPEPAAGYYLQAAKRALSLYADNEALRYLSRGIELSRNLSRRFDLLALRESIYGRTGDRLAQQIDLEQLDTLAGELADEDRICEVLSHRIKLQDLLGERHAEAQLIAALKERASASGDLRWQAAALKAEAEYQVLLSQYEPARVSLEKSLAFRRLLDDPTGQVECYALLSEIAVYRGRFEEAQALLKQAISVAGPEANQSLLVRTLRATCIASIVQVEIDTAHKLGLQMLELCRNIGDREGEADAHTRVAGAASRLFHVEEARQHYEQAQTLYAMLGNRRGQAAVLVNAGMLAANLGQYAEAIEASRRAERLFREIDDLRGQTVCLVNIAEHALRQGDYRTAKATGAQGLKLARGIKSNVLEAYALANLGAAERELGQLERAISHMEAGLEIRRTLEQAPVELATDLCDLAVAYMKAGKVEAAQEVADEMLSLLSADPGHMTYPEYILWVAAQTYHAVGKAERANELLAQAYQVMQEKMASIPDAESRTTFAQLPYHRELLAARERDQWP